MRLPCSFSSAVDNCFVAIPDLVNNGMYMKGVFDDMRMRARVS